MMYFRGKCPDRISAREFAAGNFRIYTDFDICCIHLSLRHGQLNERLIVKPLELLYSADYSGILPPGVECSMGALPDYSGMMAVSKESACISSGSGTLSRSVVRNRLMSIPIRSGSSP